MPLAEWLPRAGWDLKREEYNRSRVLSAVLYFAQPSQLTIQNTKLYKRKKKKKKKREDFSILRKDSSHVSKDHEGCLAPIS